LSEYGAQLESLIDKFFSPKTNWPECNVFDEYVGFVIEHWSNVDESVSCDYAHGFLSHENSTALINTIKNYDQEYLCLFADTGSFEENMPHVVIKASKEKLMNYQLDIRLQKEMHSIFYMFDTSGKWIAHVGESIIFACEHDFAKEFISQLGGWPKVLKDLEHFCASVDDNYSTWRQFGVDKLKKIFVDFK